MDDRRPAQAGAQNPAYRPAHPLPCFWPATGQAHVIMACPGYGLPCGEKGCRCQQSESSGRSKTGRSRPGLCFLPACCFTCLSLIRTTRWFSTTTPWARSETSRRGSSRWSQGNTGCICGLSGCASPRSCECPSRRTRSGSSYAALTGGAGPPSGRRRLRISLRSEEGCYPSVVGGASPGAGLARVGAAANSATGSAWRARYRYRAARASQA